MVVLIHAADIGQTKHAKVVLVVVGEAALALVLVGLVHELNVEVDARCGRHGVRKRRRRRRLDAPPHLLQIGRDALLCGGLQLSAGCVALAESPLKLEGLAETHEREYAVGNVVEVTAALVQLQFS